MVTNTWIGIDEIDTNNEMNSNLQISTDRWFDLFIGLDSYGTLLFMTWDLANHDHYSYYSFNNGATWTNDSWLSCFQVAEGTLYLDDYSMISFKPAWAY